MNRIDNSKFLLFIEPNKKEKLKIPVNDTTTEIMKIAMEEASIGIANYSDIGVKETFRNCSGYKGFHTTSCGINSNNHDYLLANGMITNSLCVFYLQYYRNSIPKSEMSKVEELISFYTEPEMKRTR